MNCRHETVKMSIPPGNPAETLDTRTRGIPERYVAGRTVSFHAVDISDPNAPVSVSQLNTPDKATDVYTSGNYAYVTDHFGLQMIDVTDPAEPTLVCFTSTPGIANSVAVSDTYVYVGGPFGLLIFKALP